MRGRTVKYAAIALATLLLAGCAARKKVVEDKKKEKEVLVGDRDQMMDKILSAGFREDSTERKVSLTLDGKSVGGVLRMVRGKRIWLNISVLGITFARGMFTPDSLRYYEKVGKTAFEGRWDEFHRLSPVLSALDYDLLENLLCGRSAFALTAQDFAADAGGQYLEFFRRDPRSGVSLAAAVHRSTFRLMRQELLSPDGKVGLRAEYVYSGSDTLPQSVQLTLIGLSERTVRLDYSPARRMQAQFPFKVPGGYRDARELLRTMGVDI